MRRIPSELVLVVAIVLAVFGGMALATQNKDTVQVPGGLALSECRGYEDWPAVAVSLPEEPDVKLDLIVANSTMMDAYRAGIPATASHSPTAPRS